MSDEQRMFQEPCAVSAQPAKPRRPYTKGHRLTKEQRQELEAMAESGATLKVMSEKFGISRQRVHQIVRKLPGYQAYLAARREHYRNMRDMRQHRREARIERAKKRIESWRVAFKDMIARGLTFAQMMQELQVPFGTIAYRLRRLRQLFPGEFEMERSAQGRHAYACRRAVRERNQQPS